MVIQLKKEIKKEEQDESDFVCGIDDGSKHVGIAIIQKCKTHSKPIFKGTIEQRQDVKGLLDTRRGYRRYKRNHKRYRPARFDNRSASKRNNRIAPSILQKRQATLRVINRLSKYINISEYHLQDVAIDIRALTEGREENYIKHYEDMINGENIRFDYAQHVMQGKTYLRNELSKLGKLVLTTGGDTANKRIDWNIDKSHSNDAIVINDLTVSNKDCCIKDWMIKPMRRKSKANVEGVNGFKHRDLIKYTKKNGDSYIGYITAMYPEKKQCNITTTLLNQVIYMNCILCKSNLVSGKVNHIIDLDGHIIIIKGVPANVCKQCGEYFIDTDIAIKLEKIIEDVMKNRAEIFVVNYSEAAA